MRAGSTMRAVARLATEARAAGRMRAWRVHSYGGLAELRLEEARVPPLRAPDDVLVRVSAASLNPIDVNMISGYGARALNTLRAFDGADEVEFPLVPGRDFVGTVEHAGPAARLRRGQRVWGVVPPHRQGSHAQFVLVKDKWAGPAPTRLEDAPAGGALYAALTATAALRAAGAGARARVLLLGLGGVGQAALQLLARRNAEVTVGCSGDLTDLALKLGAACALDRHHEDYHRQLEQCGPYDAVVDCAGLGGAEAGARAWRFARYVTLSTPLLREMDARAPPAACCAPTRPRPHRTRCCRRTCAGPSSRLMLTILNCCADSRREASSPYAWSRYTAGSAEPKRTNVRRAAAPGVNSYSISRHAPSDVTIHSTERCHNTQRPVTSLHAASTDVITCSAQ